MIDFPDVPEPLRLILMAMMQGVAEFLPISSSGHLNVLAAALGGHPSSLVNIALHAGTLLSIVIFYRKRIIDLLTSDRRVIPLLIVGTIPAAILGMVIKRAFPWMLEDLMLTGVMLVVTGLALMYFQPKQKKKKQASQDSADQADANRESEICATNNKRNQRDYIELGWRAALFIGLFQAFALMPGISRSGFTILAGVLVGLRHQSAATFSFLLAIPAILGATILETVDVLGSPPTEPIGMLLLAALVAFIVGLLSLVLLIKMLDQRKLHWFALWVLPLGMIVVIWQLYERLNAMVS